MKKDVPSNNLSRNLKSDFGLIETGRFINRQFPLWAYHTKRLERSLKELSWKRPSVLNENNLQHVLDFLLEANEAEHGKFRLSVFQEKGETTCLLYLARTASDYYVFNQGLCLGVFDAARKVEPLNHKYNHDQVYVKAQAFKEQSSFDACLVLDDEGNISDEVISNVWAFKNGQIFTPALPSKGVAGVMRSFILENANVQVAEIEMRPDDLETYDEIFLSNGTMGIRSVESYRGKIYPHQQTKDLFDHLKISLNIE